MGFVTDLPLLFIYNSPSPRYIFTLIHKFRAEPGRSYPMISDRSDIIVMTDEDAVHTLC